VKSVRLDHLQIQWSTGVFDQLFKILFRWYSLALFLRKFEGWTKSIAAVLWMTPPVAAFVQKFLRNTGFLISKLMEHSFTLNSTSWGMIINFHSYLKNGTKKFISVIITAHQSPTTVPDQSSLSPLANYMPIFHFLHCPNGSGEVWGLVPFFVTDFYGKKL
jgi:hypothetical protein